ncbi:MAG: hypothetical protein FWC70_11880 [Defluviitaleaceae bacterium]|nr:hypothetical protein [Defluviitaleaceae bacterium]
MTLKRRCGSCNGIKRRQRDRYEHTYIRLRNTENSILNEIAGIDSFTDLNFRSGGIDVRSHMNALSERSQRLNIFEGTEE